MINLDLYKSIVDANSLINFIIYFSAGCIIINFIISLIHDIRSKNNKNNSTNNNKKESEKRLSLIEFIGGISIVLIILILTPILAKISKYISFMYIPSIILFFYMVYIKPMTTDKPSAFKFDYYEYGAVVTWALFIFSKINYNDLFISITSEGALQVICILVLLFEIYSSFYCLLLNIYFVIKNLKKINIDIFINKYENLIKLVYSKFDFNNLILKFDNTSKLVYNKHNSKNKKILLFLPNFVLDTIMCTFKYTISLFLSMILKPFFTIISFIFSKIIQLSNTNENQINYGLTKIVWTFSIIFVYIILQMNNVFQAKIINTYEFISSVIIIPIILEALISLKEKIKISINQ